MKILWIRQSCVQGFYCEYITKKTVNVLEHMKIADSIYEGFVKPSYKILLVNMPTILITEGK